MVKTKKIAMISLALIMAFALMFGVLMPVKTVEATEYGGFIGAYEEVLEIVEGKSGVISDADIELLYDVNEQKIRGKFTELESRTSSIYNIFAAAYDGGIVGWSDGSLEAVKSHNYLYEDTYDAANNSLNDVKYSVSYDMFVWLYNFASERTGELSEDDWDALAEFSGASAEDLKNYMPHTAEGIVEMAESSLAMVDGGIRPGSNSGSGNSGSGASTGVVTNTLVATLSVVVLGAAITLLSVRKKENN